MKRNGSETSLIFTIVISVNGKRTEQNRTKQNKTIAKMQYPDDDPIENCVHMQFVVLNVNVNPLSSFQRIFQLTNSNGHHNPTDYKYEMSINNNLNSFP